MKKQSKNQTQTRFQVHPDNYRGKFKLKFKFKLNTAYRQICSQDYLKPEAVGQLRLSITKLAIDLNYIYNMSKFIIKIALSTVFAGTMFLGCKINMPRYDSNLGYEFDKNDKDFIEIAGDFHKLKYAPGHTIYLTCWYHSSAYQGYTKHLETGIQIPQKTVDLVDGSDITVTSTNFGPLDFTNYTTKHNYVMYRYSKNVDSLNKKAISNLVFQDSVIFKIGDKRYLFLSKMR